jgi:hypothetical protein
MAIETTHNPDRYMSDLRLILSQGRKRIGLLIGAGAPSSILIDPATKKISETGVPLIPSISGLTKKVLEQVTGKEKDALNLIAGKLGTSTNIEAVLSNVRLLSRAAGLELLHGLNGEQYKALSKLLCESIGKIVQADLPNEPNAYSELVGWISGTARSNPIEIFTTNYDLLFETAFEKAKVPYFDGFSGGRTPFFDASSVATNELPARWARLWKLHGSLGWALDGNEIVRGRGTSATELIYPDDLKYDQIRKLPYTAFFERLRQFLLTPDSLLVANGFSFSDAHVSAILDEALAANANTAVFAFQYGKLDEEKAAVALAQSKPNFSAYASDGAVVRGVAGPWKFGEAPNKDWQEIRRTFWDVKHGFSIGDFSKLCRFIALSQAMQIGETVTASVGDLNVPGNATP